MRSLVGLLLFFPVLLFGQYQDYSQNKVNSSPLETNPALAGAFDSGKLNLGYYSFFKHDTPSRIFANYNTHVSNINSGIGINYKYTDLIFINESSVGLTYAYHLDLSKFLGLSVGVSGDYYNTKNNYISYHSYVKPYDRRLTLSSGIILHHNRFFLSVNANQINVYNTNPTFNYPFQLNTIYAHKFSFFDQKKLELIPSIQHIYDYNFNKSYHYFEAGLHINYERIKGIIGLQFKDDFVYAGLGYQWKSITLQYMIYQSINTSYNINLFHQTVLQFMLPKTINRSTNALNFRLF